MKNQPKISWISKEVNLVAIAATPQNYKIKTKLGQERLRESLKSFGLAGNVVCNYAGKFGDTSKLVLIDGNSRREEAIADGVKKLWVSLPSRLLTVKEFKEMSAMFDFAKAGEVDMERIEQDLGTTASFYEKYKVSVPARLLDELGINGPKVFEKQEVVKSGALREKFIEPPFSVLDAKTANWQQRKEEWKKLGIDGNDGRDPNLLGNLDYFGSTNTSIFDPALTELMYFWFCKKGGAILDPFAGGAVRGIIAHYLGYSYTGIDLSRKQIDVNREQAQRILKKGNQPNWLIGDSNEVLDKVKSKFDFVFSCPPYADLEVYSNLKNDLSNMPYDKFVKVYSEIILKSTKLLKSKSHACFVVGEVRDKHGYYYDFISDTKRAFIDAGLRFYNDAVLLNAVGSASMRSRQFDKSQKLIKIHQNVLTFYKP